jgi:hypothetical protein
MDKLPPPPKKNIMSQPQISRIMWRLRFASMLRYTLWSFGWHRVAWYVNINISEETTALIFRSGNIWRPSATKTPFVTSLRPTRISSVSPNVTHLQLTRKRYEGILCTRTSRCISIKTPAWISLYLSAFRTKRLASNITWTLTEFSVWHMFKGQIFSASFITVF